MVMASNPPNGDQLDHHPQGLSDGVLGSEPGMLAGREPMDFKSNLPKLSTCSLRNLAEASKEDLLMFSGIPELSEWQALTWFQEDLEDGNFLWENLRMFDLIQCFNDI